MGAARTARSNTPANYELCFGVNCHPRPYVSETKLAPLIEGHVLLLGIAERPNFIALDSLASDVANVAVLKIGPRNTNINQQRHDRVNVCSAQSCGGPHRVSFDECRNNAHSLLAAQAIHCLRPICLH